MDIEEELERIEGEVEKGNYDLRGLGFWKIVAEVKKDPSLVERFADRIGGIDRKVFEERVWFRVGVLTGHLAEVAGTILGAGLVWLSLSTPSGVLQGLSLVFASLILSSTLHPLAHYTVGRAFGIQFLFYFPDGPAKIEPSLKTDYSSYLKAKPRERALMHISGPVATNGVALICLAIGLYTGVPTWALLALAGYFLLALGTEIFVSPMAGDMKRVKRELRY